MLILHVALTTVDYNALALSLMLISRSDKLKPFWLSISDVDLSQLQRLNNTVLTREPTAEYRDAVARALSIPGCYVVPFFGSFLRDLQMVLSGIPSVVVLVGDEGRLEVSVCVCVCGGASHTPNNCHSLTDGE